MEEAISPQISEETNLRLIQIPDNQEIKKAVFAIHGDKAPGHDGFSANFFQSFWDIVGDEVCNDTRLFFTQVSINKRYNETHVGVIPKTKNPKKVMDYRPIALCSTLYKIIAKILCNRLKPLCLTSYLHTNQHL